MSAGGVFDAALGLLLKGVQNIHGPGEPHGIDGAVGAAGVDLDDLQHAGAAKPRERLGVNVLASFLGLSKSEPHDSFHFVRKAAQDL